MDLPASGEVTGTVLYYSGNGEENKNVGVLEVKNC